MSLSAPGPFFSLSSLGLPTSQAQFLQVWLQAMQAAFPGYVPGAANQEYIQAQVFASWAEDEAQLCNTGASELFRQFGSKLLGLPYEQGTAAQTVVTITAQDTAGYELPLGSQLTLTLGGAPVAFQTASTLVIAPGSGSGNVTASAVQTGSLFNGAGAPAEMISQITWVTDVTPLSSASGGVDQENDDQYLQRLAATLRLLAPRPITASDFATMAANFQPAAGTDQQEVGRATSIDGYDPGGNTYGNEREVTVCVTDAGGNALDADTLTAVQAYLAGLREANFLVNVVSPNYTTVYVAVTVKGQAGYPSAAVQGNVQAALLAYLNPTSFGLPQGAIGGWTNQPTVYLSRIEAIVQNTVGVDHIPAGLLAVGASANPTNTTSDLLLPGAFPLPISSTSSIPLSAVTVI